VWGVAYRCRFFILGWGQDNEDKDGKKTRGKNRTGFLFGKNVVDE
jgi:hypothetical protein